VDGATARLPCISEQIVHITNLHEAQLMTNKPVLDDLEAVRTVVSALEGFGAIDQERILRWTREKLGLLSDNGGGPPANATLLKSPTMEIPTHTSKHSANIKTFVTAKNPKSDSQSSLRE
jgi:hypothetical protein